MSYAMMGLGQSGAEQRARNRRMNDDGSVRDEQVGPGFWDGWLDAAIEPRGIAGSEAGRVPGAIKEVLEASGAEVDKVCWGGGSGCGGEATRGRIYVRWKPARVYNAVTYADIARNLFASAADQFSAGSKLIMHRYRVEGGLFSSDKYVYPEGGSIPASAPAAAHRTTSEDIEAAPPPEQLTITERQMSGGMRPAGWVAVGIGGTVVLGLGYLYYRGRPRRNRRRRRRTSR